MKPESLCIPYGTADPTALKSGNLTWDWSGFRPVAEDWTEGDQAKRYYTITVTNSEPIWYYCSQDDSCMGFGMIGAINP